MHVDRLHPRVPIVDPKTGEPTLFFFRWLLSMWERSGGPTDKIEDLEDELGEIPTVDPYLVELEKKVRQLEIELALKNESTQARALEKRIEALERQWPYPYNDTDLRNRVHNLETQQALYGL